MADVFINPTYEDNFPTTNIESLACGTPVITYRTGGSPEAITRDCGQVVVKNDVAGLVKAVKMYSETHPSAEACIDRSKQFDRRKAFDTY